MAVCAGLLLGIAGVRYARSLRQTTQRLTRWESILRHLTLILSEGASTIPEAFEQAATDKEMPDETMRALAEAMRNQPLVSLPELCLARQLPLPEKDIIQRMSERISHGSLTSRCQAVEQARAEMALLSGTAREKSSKDARMWTTLGWVGGACLTLMLI